MSRRPAALSVLLVAGAALATACDPRDRRTPDDTMVVIHGSASVDLDPRFAITSSDANLSQLVAPGLTTVDHPALEVRLALAESIAPVEPLVWEAVVRADARFSTGAPVTAHDVAYTYGSVLDPATGSLHHAAFAERFAAVTAVDDRRVRFSLRKPLATLMTDLNFGIVSARAAQAQGGRFRDGRVVGAGPYEIVSFSPERVLLRASAYHHAGPPGMRLLDVRTVRDANARALMLVGGSADLCLNGIRADLVGDLARKPRVTVARGPSAILTYLMFNTEDPTLRDVRVRQAVAFAIDRERIVRAKFHGQARLATGMLPAVHWAYNPAVPTYRRDLARARALLDAAGYPDPDGPGGRPRLRLTYKTSADQLRVAVARSIVAQLAEVGIAVELRAFEFGTFFADVKQGKFQLASMQTIAITEPDFFWAYFHSARIPTPAQPHLHNRWRYRNAEVDRLTEAGKRTLVREERRRLYGRVQEILATELPVLPLWHEDNIAVMNAAVTGYELLPSASWGPLALVRKQ